MKIPGTTSIEVNYNADYDVPEIIETYFQCGQCLDEMPPGEVPRTWARLNVGIDVIGNIQVFCVRHNINVVLLTLQAAETRH